MSNSTRGAVAWAVFRHLRRYDPAPTDADRLELIAPWAVGAALGNSGDVALVLALRRIDACVIAVLVSVAVAPGRPVTRWADLAGSFTVALYLLRTAGRAVSGRGATATARRG